MSRALHAGEGAKRRNTYYHILLTLGHLMTVLRLRGLDGLTLVRRMGIFSGVVGN